MSIIKSGSITQNPTNLLKGSTTDQITDRGTQLISDSPVVWTGTEIQFSTDPINIFIQLETGVFGINRLLIASSPIALANGEAVIARLNRVAGPITLVAGTYPNLAVGEYAIVNVASINTIDLDRKDHVILFRRYDAGSGVQFLLVPLHKQIIKAGQSVYLGASSSGGSGSGTGDDLNALTFKASLTELFTELPSDINTGIDYTANKTDSTLYNIVNQYIRISYDASKTVTGTGTAMTISGTPSFTVKAGDILVVGSETRRITVVTTQTSYTIASAFTVDPSTAACNISQVVYSKDLNAYAGNGLAPSTAFSTNISQILVSYEDSTSLNDIIYDANTTPVIAFTASSDGTTYTNKQVRPTNLNDDFGILDLPTSSTNLYLRFFSNASSGSGSVNLLKYKTFFHRDASFQDGSILNQAYAFTDGVGTEINCSTSALVSGKTRLPLSWTYPVGVNSGTPNGAIKVYLNGQKIPRFVDATLTPDASYKEIDQQTIELDGDYSALNYSLEVIQDVAVVDNIDVNTTNITALQEIQQKGFQAFVDDNTKIVATATVGTPAAGTFYSTIVNRASIADLTANLKAHMGIERIMTQQIVQLQNEFGPSGEPVWSTPNDLFGQIRFVGSQWSNAFGSQGSFAANASTTNLDGYIEVTFYGTGLNILTLSNGTAANFVASVDGGANGANMWPGTTSNLLQARNYAQNQVINAVSGLTLGVHTVIIKNNNASVLNLNIHGIEILNETSTIKLNPGSAFANGKKLTLNAQQSLAYNSTFESGTLGTRGGKVLVYQKSDGTIAKAVTPTNVASATFGSTDHTNEEIARTHHFREFGAGRTDDFSLVTGVITNKAFTLDDGTTTLVADAITVNTEAIYPTAANNFITITFVGTGLDVENVRSDAATLGSTTIFVDGSSISTLPADTNIQRKTIKLVSGLPYGTHTVKIRYDSGNTYFYSKFIVYQPKKPAIPTGAIELADYNVMANYVVNATPGNSTIATGVLRKLNTREWVYVNGTTGTANWQLNYDPLNHPESGNQGETDRLGAYLEYTFIGTGFEIRGQCVPARSNNISLTLNGLAATTGNFPSLVSSTYGGMSFAAGVLSESASTQLGAGLSISGLPYGKYTLRFTNNVATTFVSFNAMDIITPIHSAKSNLYADLQNTLSVGSQGICDSRKTSAIKEALPATKAWAQAVGITSGPTTSSTTAVPLPDMSVTVKTSGGALEIFYSVCSSMNAIAAFTAYSIYIDGAVVGKLKYDTTSTVNSDHTITDSIIVPVSPGIHKVDIFWQVGSNTALQEGTSRNLTVKEI